MDEQREPVTELMAAAGGGDQVSAAQLLPVVYQQLRAAAQAHLANERPGHTLLTFPHARYQSLSEIRCLCLPLLG